MTLDEIRGFHAAQCTPSAVTLVVGGAITPDRAHRLGRRRPRRLARPGRTAGARSRRRHAGAAAARALLVPRPGAPQSELRIGQVGVARTTTDYHALVLWNAVLGGQFVSRLNLTLRQQKGYTYGVRSGFDFRRGRGPFTVQTSVQASATADAVGDVLRKWRTCATARRRPTAS